MSITAIAIAVGVFLAGIIGAYLKGSSAGESKQKVKQAEARNENLNRIKTAAEAGARVQPDDPGVVSDPFNRDH